MRSFFIVAAAAAALALSSGASALPLPTADAVRANSPAPQTDLVQVHHKPGHIGGRGRHLGWYKSNRGKKKGWRRWR